MRQQHFQWGLLLLRGDVAHGERMDKAGMLGWSFALPGRVVHITRITSAFIKIGTALRRLERTTSTLLYIRGQ